MEWRLMLIEKWLSYNQNTNEAVQIAHSGWYLVAILIELLRTTLIRNLMKNYCVGVSNKFELEMVLPLFNFSECSIGTHVEASIITAIK